jgi:hypothetical protein
MKQKSNVSELLLLRDPCLRVSLLEGSIFTKRLNAYAIGSAGRKTRDANAFFAGRKIDANAEEFTLGGNLKQLLSFSSLSFFFT